MPNGRLVALGAARGIPTPFNAALVALLKGVEYKSTEARARTEDDYARIEAAAAGTKRPA